MTSDVSTIIDTVKQCAPAFVNNARQHCRLFNKQLELKGGELEGAVKMFSSFLQQLTAGDGAQQFTDDTLAAILCLLEDIDALTVIPIAATSAVIDVVKPLAASSHVVIGVDSSRSQVSFPRWCMRGHVNIVKIIAVVSAGEAIPGITPADVVVMFDSESFGWAVSSVTVDGNTVAITIVLAPDCAGVASAHVDIGGTAFTLPPLHV